MQASRGGYRGGDWQRKGGVGSDCMIGESGRDGRIWMEGVEYRWRRKVEGV